MPPHEQQADLWGKSRASEADRELAGPDVMLTLGKAIRVAHSVAVTVASGQARLDAFDDHASEGVSANLCNALGDLGGHSRNRPVEIGFSWARSRPRPDSPEESGDSGDSGEIAFSASMVAVLAKAGEELERLAKSGQAQITGQVETLNLTPGETPRIKIVGELRTDTQAVISRRALWILVTRAQYDEAIGAQREGWRTQADGQITALHGRLEMRPGRFAVMRD